jgi:hypothetical protein
MRPTRQPARSATPLLDERPRAPRPFDQAPLARNRSRPASTPMPTFGEQQGASDLSRKTSRRMKGGCRSVPRRRSERARGGRKEGAPTELPGLSAVGEAVGLVGGADQVWDPPSGGALRSTRYLSNNGVKCQGVARSRLLSRLKGRSGRTRSPQWSRGGSPCLSSGALVEV